MNGNYFDFKGFFFVLKVSFLALALFVGGHQTYTHIQDGALLSLQDIIKNTFVAEDTIASPPKQAIKEEPSPFKETRIIVEKTIDERVPKEGKFIGIDLNSMKLYTYQDGELVDSYTVLSKGKPGSRWETPRGSYSVTYKNENHFSSIGKVYLPHSMQFFGNFFIHGWPHYPNGTPVQEGYSGGCIRLSDEAAQAVYEFTDLNTPLYVHEEEVKEEAKTLSVRNVSPPLTSAASYLVADLKTGQVFLEKNPQQKRAIASISKLMTAVVANETISFDKTIYITDNAISTYGTQGDLYVGQSMSLHTLLHPLLLESSNDAATAIADYLGFETFINIMNRKAFALDMKNTQFADPSGLSPHNISTAQDLYNLAKYIYEKKRYIFDLSTIPSKTLTIEGTGLPQSFHNNNPMIGRAGYLGGKNGYTDEARKTLLTLHSLPLGSKERPVVIIVLGSEDHTTDTLKLRSWLLEAVE